MKRLPTPSELIGEDEIRRKVAELGAAISKKYLEERLAVIAISNGAIPFVADLIRAITIPMRVDTVSAQSYVGDQSSGDVAIDDQLKIDIQDARALVVDDILDTGRTLSKIVERLRARHQPLDVKTCVLLDKPSRRVVDIKADYVGFVIPDKFVVGYGLDYDEYYRNLPYIGVLDDQSEA